jgi:hypothetical protein
VCSCLISQKCSKVSYCHRKIIIMFCQGSLSNSVCKAGISSKLRLCIALSDLLLSKCGHAFLTKASHGTSTLTPQTLLYIPILQLAAMRCSTSVYSIQPQTDCAA